MASQRQRAAARRNLKKAQAAARKKLAAEARKRGIEGRSKMGKSDLVPALRNRA